MLTSHPNAIRGLPKASPFTVLFLAVLAVLAMASGAFAVIPPPTPGQVIDGDGYYCPAEYHSCSTQGTTPYFPPDPFDRGAACDHDFLNWDVVTQTVDPSSCYGQCASQTINNPNPDPSCYVGCQDGYSSCLRTAFSLGQRMVPLSTQSPGNTPNLAGNVFRSCLADRVPSAYAAQYQQCLAEGKSTWECCLELAASFP
ncbi:MAG TPA: hypothetical protein VGP73_03910 [Thermoanaerobaculia bacterium]